MNALQRKRLAKKVYAIYGIILKTLFAYIAVIGIFGFALFIAEESAQVIMWSNFSASDTRRYDLMQKNCDAIKRINKTAKRINNYTMWLNPFQMWGYQAFHNATDLYVASLEAEILANEPNLLIGRQVSVLFHYKSTKKLQSGKLRLTSGKLSVELNRKPETNPVQLSGVLELIDESLVVVTN